MKSSIYRPISPDAFGESLDLYINETDYIWPLYGQQTLYAILLFAYRHKNSESDFMSAENNA